MFHEGIRDPFQGLPEEQKPQESKGRSATIPEFLKGIGGIEASGAGIVLTETDPERLRNIIAVAGERLSMVESFIDILKNDKNVRDAIIEKSDVATYDLTLGGLRFEQTIFQLLLNGAHDRLNN